MSAKFDSCTFTNYSNLEKCFKKIFLIWTSGNLITMSHTPYNNDFSIIQHVGIYLTIIRNGDLLVIIFIPSTKVKIRNDYNSSEKLTA